MWTFVLLENPEHKLHNPFLLQPHCLVFVPASAPFGITAIYFMSLMRSWVRADSAGGQSVTHRTHAKRLLR